MRWEQSVNILMEKKEKFDQSLTQVTEMRTNVVACRQCDYTAQSYLYFSVED